VWHLLILSVLKEDGNTGFQALDKAKKRKGGKR
jgi:hypothetical protein